MAFYASLRHASKRQRLSRPASTSLSPPPPTVFTSAEPYTLVSPITPPISPRAPPIRSTQPILPTARKHAAILPRSTTDPQCNPAAAMAKPGQEVHYVQYPYYVRRTAVSGALPVYTDLRGSGTKQKLTVVRGIDGDVEALRLDIEKQFPKFASLLNPYNRTIVLRGHVDREIKLWLRDRGF